MTIQFPPKIADIAERAGSTFVQAFLVGWLALDSMDATSLQILAVGALAATLAVVKVLVQDAYFPVGRVTTFAADLANRVFFTFGEVFLAVLIVAPGDSGTWAAAWTAGIAAALSAIKAGIATRIGQNSAAVLPSSLDPTPMYV